MIIKQSDSKKTISLTNDLNRLLNYLKSENNTLIDSVVEDFFKLGSLAEDRINGMFFVIYWNRFTNKTKIDFEYDYDSRLDFTPHEKDFVSWIPLLASNTTKIRSEAKLLKLLNDKNNDKNLIYGTPSFSDLKNNLEQLKIFLKQKITSKILRDQKSIFNSKESGDWSFFFNKIEKGERYPIDILPLNLQDELFWSKTELFLGGSSSSIDKRFYTNFYRCRSNDLFLIVNDVLELHPPYEHFEDQIVDLAISKINDPNQSPYSQNNLIQFINKLSVKNPNFKTKIKDKFEILNENIDNYLENLEFNLYKRYTSQTSNNPYSMIGNQFSETEKIEAKKILGKRIEEFLGKNNHRPSNYIHLLDTHSYTSFTKKHQLVESFKNLESLENAIYFAKNNNRELIYSPLCRNLDGLTNINDGVYSTVEKLLIKNNAKTTEFVKEELRSLLSSSFVYFHDRLREHIHFVIDVLETVEI